MLFNMTLDWVLSVIPQEVCIVVGNLSFADDVVLSTSSPAGLRRSVTAMVATAKVLGLEVSHSKCITLGIVADRSRSTARLSVHRPRGNYINTCVISWAVGREVPQHLLARYVTGLGRL